MPSNKFITSLEELRALYEPALERAIQKQKSELDEPSLEFINDSPFLCLATTHPDGSTDCSPKGDPAGFVKVIDSKTIAIPDRKGNNRLDSLTNILANPKVGIVFLIPGRNETLRVNGRAKISVDKELLSRFEIEQPMFKGRYPTTAIVVDVDEVYFHCPKALIRSELWKTEIAPELSSYIKASSRQLGLSLSEDEIQENAKKYNEALKDRLY